MATLLIRLGAYYVLAGVLAISLKAALVVIVLLAGLLLWHWYRK